MDELKSILRYWCMVFWETWGDIGIFSAIVATGAGMTAVLLAAHFGFAQKGEIPELIFIIAVSADMANYCQARNKSAFRKSSFSGGSHHELF